MMRRLSSIFSVERDSPSTSMPPAPIRDVARVTLPRQQHYDGEAFPTVMHNYVAGHGRRHFRGTRTVLASPVAPQPSVRA